MSEALNVSHAATEAHGIGCHDAMMSTLVGNGDAVESAIASIEVERSQIDPCGASHLLVDTELSLLATMPDRIEHIIHAVVERLITDIDRIASCFGEVWLVVCQGLMGCTACGLHHSCRSCLKGVFSVMIDARVFCKSLQGSLFPLMASVELVVESFVRIVIDNDLCFLPVAFTWRKDISSR